MSTSAATLRSPRANKRKSDMSLIRGVDSIGGSARIDLLDLSTLNLQLQTLPLSHVAHVTRNISTVALPSQYIHVYVLSIYGNTYFALHTSPFTLVLSAYIVYSFIPASNALSNPNTMRESMASRGCVIFVGNLPGDVREREVEDLFVKVRHTLQRNELKGGALHELFILPSF